MAKKKWSEWEKQVADDLDGKITPGSGNQWFAKGDVITHDWVISCKQTDKESFSVKFTDLREAESISLPTERFWALAVQMGQRKFVVLDYHDFLYLVKKE